MKKNLILLIMLLGVINAFAEVSIKGTAVCLFYTNDVESKPVESDDVSNLIVWHTNGTITKFALDDEPVTTYSDGYLTLTTNKTTISLPLEEVRRFTYQLAAETAISDALKTIQKVKFDSEGISFSQFTKDTDINVYSTSGLLVRTIHAKAGQTSNVSLKSLAAGVYIVKVNGVTYKFLKK